ncbi:hypothetical protein [Sporomusa aerivorans]|uniref:hypothetical protein n=1 Tax=Sporomusa aerivorans TaxID=204936 RepID=UPI00352B7990
MALTKEQKRRIYEEERERIRARERIEAERNRKRQPKLTWVKDVIIVIGFVLMLYIVMGGR